MTEQPARPQDTPPEERQSLSDADFRQQLVGIIPALRVFSRGLCSNRALADDMVQDALTRGWAARKSYAAGSNFRAWMFMILRNQYYTTARKNARIVPWDPEAAERILVTPASQDWGIEVSDVTAALQKISPEQREVLLLVGANGLSYQEAAEIAGCAIGTIKSRLARGRVALQALLEGDDSDPDGKSPAGGQGALRHSPEGRAAEQARKAAGGHR